MPILDGVLAWMTCDLEQLHRAATTPSASARAHDARAAHGDPLVWYRGDYRGIV